MSLTQVELILYICAALCFALFASQKFSTRVHLLGLGVFFWSLVPLLETIHKLR